MTFGSKLLKLLVFLSLFNVYWFNNLLNHQYCRLLLALMPLLNPLLDAGRGAAELALTPPSAPSKAAFLRSAALRRRM